MLTFLGVGATESGKRGGKRGKVKYGYTYCDHIQRNGEAVVSIE